MVAYRQRRRRTVLGACVALAVVGAAMFVMPDARAHRPGGPGVPAPDFPAARSSDPAVTGSAGFDEPVSYPTGAAPTDVALADLDGNGTLDLVVVSRGNPDDGDGQDPRGAVSVRTGDGLGGFGGAVSYPVNEHPVAVAVADLDGDGRQDLAVLNRASADVSVLRGDGRGGFAAARVVRVGPASGPSSLAVGDVTGDAAVDLVVGRERAGGLVVLEGMGGGSFGPPTEIADVDATAVGVVDLNADGILDIVAAHAGRLDGTGDAGVVVLRGSSAGPGTPEFFPAALAPGSLSIGDVDADGVPDLVVTSNDSSATPIVGSASVLRGDGRGGFLRQQRSSTGTGIPAAAALGDLDGDGRLDLAVANAPAPSGPAGVLRVLPGDGAGGLLRPEGRPLGPQPSAIALGLVDPDGAVDAVVTDLRAGIVSVVRNAGASNLTRNPSFESDTAGWASYTAAVRRVAAADAPDGGFVARVTHRAGAGYSIGDTPAGAATVQSVRAGERFVAGCTVRAANSQSVGRVARVIVRERVGGAIVRETTAIATLTGTFVRIAVTAEAAGGAGHTLGVACEQIGARPGDAFDVDLVTLARVGAVGGAEVPGSGWTPVGVNTKRVSAFTTSVARDIVALRAFVDGRGGGAGSQPVTGILFGGTAAGPTLLIAATAPVRVLAGAPPGWIELPLDAPVRVPPGTYWVGLHSGGTVPLVRVAGQRFPGGLRLASDTFEGGPTFVFGSATTAATLLSVYAVGG